MHQLLYLQGKCPRDPKAAKDRDKEHRRNTKAKIRNDKIHDYLEKTEKVFDDKKHVRNGCCGLDAADCDETKHERAFGCGKAVGGRGGGFLPCRYCNIVYHVRCLGLKHRLERAPMGKFACPACILYSSV